MDFRVAMVCIMPFIIGFSIVANMCLVCTTCVNRTGCTNQSLVFRLVWVRSPIATIRTTAALANHVWCHYITTLRNCTTYFIAFQILFRQISLIIHIPPGTSLVIHMDNIAFHFRKWRIVADDSLRLNSSQHFIVSCHEPIFLILPIVMFRCHIGRHRNRAPLFNPLKAKIKGGYSNFDGVI